MLLGVGTARLRGGFLVVGAARHMQLVLIARGTVGLVRVFIHA